MRNIWRVLVLVIVLAACSGGGGSGSSDGGGGGNGGGDGNVTIPDLCLPIQDILNSLCLAEDIKLGCETLSCGGEVETGWRS